MTTTPTDFDIRRIGGRIGAEITGVDLAGDLDEGILKEVKAALLEHKALVFRDQDLDDEGQIRFASQFGALTSAHPTVPGIAEQPQILPVDSERGAANVWHTDVTFVQSPPKASTLRGIVIPPYGGNTLIANTAAAYRDLPKPLRDLADTLWAVHTNDYDYAGPQGEDDDSSGSSTARCSSPRSTARRTRSCASTPRPASAACSSAAFAQTHRGTEHDRVEGRPAPAAGVCQPAGERAARPVEPGRRGDLRQPHHPALRARRLRHAAPPPQPRHHRR